MRPAIVALWLWLLYVQYSQPQAPETDPAAGVSLAGEAREKEEWMGVYIDDRKVGYARRRFAPGEGGSRFEERSFLRLSVLDTEQVVRTELRGSVGPDLQLRSFTLTLRSGAGALEAEGRVEDRELDLKVSANGEESRQRFVLNDPIYVPSTAREHLVRSGLRLGRDLTVSVFDPSSMQNHPLHLSVVALEANGSAAPVWRVREQFRGIETTVWLSERGEVLREQGPMGFTAVRETRETALTGGWKEGEGFDLMAAIAVPAEELANPRALQRLEVRIEGLASVKLPVDARQRVAGDRVIIEREENGGSFILPYRGEDWQTELAATPFLQADHPRLQAKAAEILNGETDARGAAGRLRSWIYRELEKVPTASIPNALQALAMGEGDCNEHAVLFAALARAAGLPARVVAGTVYSDGVFLYHAWNEVWLGSSWVSVDATMDQMPADATHIKLVEGGPETHVALLPLIGSLSIDVLHAE